MSKRAEEYAVKIHDTAIKEGEKYANSHGESIIEEICYGRGFKAGCIQGYEQAEKDLAITAEDVGCIFNLVRQMQVKYNATSACYQEVADIFNKDREEEKK